ncbi:MAG TPA: hypothetical protein VEP90_02675 [Methylomirabilota bacterium]|nr:hypothetical protein [Methylomirabilota bacterium]
MSDTNYSGLANDYPVVTLRQLQASLEEPYPVWFLSPRGDVLAINLLAIWLWNASKLNDLLGVNVFDIYSRNFKRIPKDINHEFFSKKSAVVKRLFDLFGGQSYLAFISLMKSDPYLKEIFDWELEISKNEWEFDREWKYPLRLLCPDTNSSHMMMEFQVTVSRLEGDLGYLAIYEPGVGSKITQPLVEREYRHVIALSPEQSYVHYLDVGITALNLPYPYVNQLHKLLFTELFVERGVRPRIADSDENLEEVPLFDFAFQEKFREAILFMINAPEYQKVLACFCDAYEYRKNFPWLPESREISDEISQNGLSYALRAALSTYIVPEVLTIGGIDRFVKTEDFHSEGRKDSDLERMSALATAVEATINEGFSLKRFKNQLTLADVDVTTITPAALRAHIAAALVRYYNRRKTGISRDAL